MTSEFFEKQKIPMICTPLTGKTKLEILKQLQKTLQYEPDLIEWRADFFTDLAETEAVLQIVAEIKAITNIPLLFTIRAVHEGGEKITLTDEEKVDLLAEVIRKTAIDIVDYETSNDERAVEQISEIAKENNKKLILSYHHFTKTPANDELVARAKRAESYGADLVKIAVMPESQEDVLRLLHLTRELDEELEAGVVTMSMGDIGGLSRVIGWAYGSMITFGVGAELSAPGQIPVEKLRTAIEQTQALVPSWK